MAMTSGSIDTLYYSPNNLDNTYSQVVGDVLRRTNKDISKNPTYRTTFNKMAKMVYDKTPASDRNLMRCNATLVEKCVAYFHSKIFELQIELLKLQEWVVENKKKVLIIFEGRDAAGKSANIEAFTDNLNPKHYRVETFDIPTEDEKKNWFKRYIKVLPKEGEIVFFDRSWYNRGIIEPAMGYCTPEQYEEFMDDVNDFEEWVLHHGIQVFKFWLDIEKSKQIARFEMRKRDPLKYWKFSDNDHKILKKWDKLSPYIERVLNETNQHVPWKKINSDDKLNGILESIQIVLKCWCCCFLIVFKR